MVSAGSLAIWRLGWSLVRRRGAQGLGLWPSCTDGSRRSSIPRAAGACAPSKAATGPSSAAPSPTSLSPLHTADPFPDRSLHPPKIQEPTPGSPLRARDIMRHDRAPLLQRRQLPGLEVSARGWYVTVPGCTRFLPKHKPPPNHVVSGCTSACAPCSRVEAELGCSAATARRPPHP